MPPKGKELFAVGIAAAGPAIRIQADECVSKHSTQTVELKTGDVTVAVFPKEHLLYVVAVSSLEESERESKN